MAAITWPDVVGFAADVATVPVAAQTVILGHVNSYFAVDDLGGEDGFELRLARIYLAAHIGSGAVPGGAGASGGTVTSESGGGLSVSYAVLATTSSTSSALGETAYGRRLIALLRSSPARAWVVL